LLILTRSTKYTLKNNVAIVPGQIVEEVYTVEQVVDCTKQRRNYERNHMSLNYHYKKKKRRVLC
jgi:hypothetical protein